MIPPVERRYVMTATEADFHRLMPLAFPDIGFDATTRRFLPPEGGWSLELGAIGRLALTSVRMTTIEVVFRFDGAEIPAVFARFMQYFQRGGG